MQPTTRHTTNTLTLLSGHRFGFNGQEKIDEVFGAGNFIDFNYRGCDPCLRRFFAVDPLTKKYPELSTYQVAGNTPIWARELEGLEPWYSTEGIPQNTLAQSNAPISMMKAYTVAHGPYSIDYAQSMGMIGTPSVQIEGATVTPNGTYPSATTTRNNDYSPYIPTANDVEAAAGTIGMGGTGVTILGVLITPFLPEVGLPLIEAGQTINNIADGAGAAADLAQGDMQGLTTKAIFKTADYSLGKLLDLSPLNEADNATQKALWGTVTSVGENKTENANKNEPVPNECR